MSTVFGTDNYEKDLALVLLEVLYRTENCSTGKYKKVRSEILKEGDTGGSGGSKLGTENGIDTISDSKQE